MVTRPSMGWRVMPRWHRSSEAGPWRCQEQGEEGIAQIRQGLVAYRGLGMAMEDPYFLALLAEAHASVGRLEEEHAALVKTGGPA